MREAQGVFVIGKVGKVLIVPMLLAQQFGAVWSYTTNVHGAVKANGIADVFPAVYSLKMILGEDLQRLTEYYYALGELTDENQANKKSDACWLCAVDRGSRLCISVVFSTRV